MTLIFWTGNFHCLKTLHNKGNQVTARNEHLINLIFKHHVAKDLFCEIYS